jgi:peptide/nickel transport system ATP-binding protein
MIMKKGEVVESGNAREVLSNPTHPYSILLKSSVLSPDPSRRDELLAPQFSSTEKDIVAAFR